MKLTEGDGGQFVLRKVLDDIPLRGEENSEPVSITCVEIWKNNLYIGTSAAEILHLVAIPGDTEYSSVQYILASRLQPSGHDVSPDIAPPGVQQILVFPGCMKAAVLCNGTMSFYSLPELSPAFPGKEFRDVLWFGGVDANKGVEDPTGTAIMIAKGRRIGQILVGEKLRSFKTQIDFPGCLQGSRRDTIACVADENSYALLEIEQQQKIPLFEIVTQSETSHDDANTHPPPITTNGHVRSISLAESTTSPSSLAPGGGQHLQMPEDASGPLASDRMKMVTRPRSSTEGSSPAPDASQPLRRKKLRPHVISPTASEFMLTTGTTLEEPGVGMFVNLDGDVSRGTLEFDRYPESILGYSFPQENGSDRASDEIEHIVALLVYTDNAIRLQLQLLDQDVSEMQNKIYVQVSAPRQHRAQSGLRQCLSVQKHHFTELSDLLLLTSYKFNSDATVNGHTVREAEAKRSRQEATIAEKYGQVVTSALVWADTDLWFLLPNPAILQLEYRLMRCTTELEDRIEASKTNIAGLLSLLGSIRDREAQNETDFVGLIYIRQKAATLMLLQLLSSIIDGSSDGHNSGITERALQESGIDPRVVLSLLKPLHSDIIIGLEGIWLNRGITDCLADDYAIQSFEQAPVAVWLMVKQYLSAWQDKRGFGSIADEKAVFDSVDSALLHTLLHLDSSLDPDHPARAAVRSKLNSIVDHWKGNFDRAVSLLERYHRLYILSRLYQSKKSSKDVLVTWKRICDRETNADDVSSEYVLGQMRRYLTVIKDQALVTEYALWLAKKSPNLAMEVLSDQNSRVKFAPAQVVVMLKEHAPGAVQLFLEHLVFAKGLEQYADDLVGYYLDSVLSVLESSEEARQALADSYTTYRALEAPKPTYLNFITENAPSDSWWQSRLRLLQLLGTGGYAAQENKSLTYSVDMVLERLAPYTQYLVSESIILDARQGRHAEALRLLVHGLGDYDTAVRYCYLGGPMQSRTIDVSQLPTRAHQEALFGVLFDEFLLIEDEETRLERISSLLGTFATYFDVLVVLDKIPDSWSLNLLTEFLLRSFRACVSAKNEAVIVKALSAAQNLQKQADFIDVCEKMGARLQLDGEAGVVEVQ